MINVRPEKPEDAQAIRTVHEQAFGQAAEADLVDALRRNDKAPVSLVAEENGSIIGHILFSPVTVESGGLELTGVGLAPVAVLPDRQNRGVGALLVEQGLDRSRDAGIPFAVVLGHARYYPRFGFMPASRFGIRSEYEVADENFMAMELRQGALRNRAGIARYQPEFNAV
jgi:putative acetyltransferase